MPAPIMRYFGCARSALFNILFALWTLVLALVMLPLLLLYYVLGARFLVELPPYIWARGMDILCRTVVGLSYKVQGQERLPASGCYIIAAQHQSAWETLIFYLLFSKPVFVIKQELTKLPVVGWFMRAYGNIAVDRSKGALALPEMLEQAGYWQERGRVIVIFPAGTRTDYGVRTRYKSGVYKMQQSLQVPVYPVQLDSGLFWGRRSFWGIKPGCIKVIVGEPIVPGKTQAEFMQELHAAM